jgi:uncharacterized protein (DUF2252 family)
MKGRSSLGFLRYAALVRIEKDGKRRLVLVDLKAAVEPAAPVAPVAEMPVDPGCAGRLEVRLRMWALCPCAPAI